jgi:hypothetical protein
MMLDLTKDAGGAPGSQDQGSELDEIMSRKAIEQ